MKRITTKGLGAGRGESRRTPSLDARSCNLLRVASAFESRATRFTGAQNPKTTNPRIRCSASVRLVGPYRRRRLRSTTTCEGETEQCGEPERGCATVHLRCGAATQFAAGEGNVDVGRLAIAGAGTVTGAGVSVIPTVSIITVISAISVIVFTVDAFVAGKVGGEASVFSGTILG